jgi:hypothetical protein
MNNLIMFYNPKISIFYLREMEQNFINLFTIMLECIQMLFQLFRLRIARMNYLKRLYKILK